MYTQIGTCPTCGAPIYTYQEWHSITPPPSIFTCNCHPEAHTQTVTSTNVILDEKNTDTPS